MQRIVKKKQRLENVPVKNKGSESEKYQVVILATKRKGSNLLTGPTTNHAKTVLGHKQAPGSDR